MLFFLFYHVLSFVSLFARQRNKRKVPKKKKKTRFLLLVSSMLIDSTKALMSFWIVCISRASSEATSEAKRFGVAENSHLIKTPVGRRNITCFLFLYSTFFLFAS